MKKTVAVLLSSIVVCHAEWIPFGISPAGTDAAVGLSPSNEVPAVTTSSGSGGPISGGLLFDTESNILKFTIGYGSAAGFTDLTGAPANLRIYGPAPTNQNAPELFDLVGFNFPNALNPALGGIIFGEIPFPSSYVQDLLAGLDYVNIATSANPDGEIRGQLISLLPTLVCPDPSTVQCGTPAVVSVQLFDPAGNAVTAVWSLNGVSVQTNQVPSEHPPTPTNIVFAGELPLGTNLVQVAVTDSAGFSASCGTTVTVIDTIPPVIVKATASPNKLWPPNHKMVVVTISAKVTNNCGPGSWRIINVQSNEPENGRGDGNTGPDWQILSDHTVALRAERSGNGSGRVYTITIQAMDPSGNLSNPKNVKVTVPKSQGHD